MGGRHCILLAAACVLLLAGLSSAAVVNITTSDDWQTMLKGLKAGDTAILASGTYNLQGSYFELVLSGTASQPIVIKGADRATTILSQNTTQNIINVKGDYYSFLDLTFTGGSRGIRVQQSTHATFERLTISSTAATAFSCNDGNGDYSYITIRELDVSNTGTSTSECFYLGCESAECTFHNSLVELNYCHNTLNAKSGYGSGIQLKTGSYRNVIRNNVLKDTKGPGILLYDDYRRGQNLIEGNLVWSTKDAGIQLTSGAVIRNNIVISATDAGIYVSANQLENDYHDLQIVHNTVYGSLGQDLYLPALSGSQFVIVNNLFLSATAFKVSAQTNTIWRDNAYVSGSVPPGVNATVGLIKVGLSVVLSAGSQNFYPFQGGALVNGGTDDYPTPVTWDFNGSPRNTTTPTIGAYEYISPTNPGWTVVPGQKSVLSSYPANSYNIGSDSGAASTLSSLLSVLIHQ